MQLHMRMLLVSFLLFFNSLVFSATLLEGDDAASSGTTFSFSVGSLVRSPTYTYVGAQTDGAGDFAFSRVSNTGTEFMAIAAEKVILNGAPDQDNPIYNHGIAFLRMAAADKPVVVPTAAGNENKNIVMYDSFSNDTIKLLSRVAQDASGSADTARIVGLTATPHNLIFAAVRGNGEVTFGVGDSGIAVLGRIELRTDEGKIIAALAQFDVAAGTPPVSTDVRALPLNISTTQLLSDSGVSLASLGDVVDLWYDSSLLRLYIVVDGTSGGAGDDGVRAVVVARFDNEKLILQDIFPASLFNGSLGTNKIIAAEGAGEQVTLSHVRTMVTTTALPYLIVVGGSTTDLAQPERNVFAVPIASFFENDLKAVPTNKISVHGSLAKKTAPPVLTFSSTTPARLVGRQFQETPGAPGDLPTSSDAAAAVGGGALPFGDIYELYVAADAVFVAAADTTSSRAGIFQSKAILDDKGKIASWTAWERIGGFVGQTRGVGFDKSISSITYITGTFATTNIVKRTTWGDGDSASGYGQLVDLLPFAQADGGIHALYDFAQTTSALGQVSLAVATGLGQVTVIETGRTVGAGFVPNSGDFETDLQIFPNAIVTQTLPGALDPKVLEFSGGVLTDLGAIIAVEVARDSSDSSHTDNAGNNGYLFVGGRNGVAVLNNNGAGWAGGQLGNGFDELPMGMKFSVVGDYTFVRKLISDRGYLYVLTDTILDRIDLNASNFSTNQLVRERLATAQVFTTVGKTGTFFDVLISEKLALLATSGGLYRLGNGRDVRTISSMQQAGWTFVSVPRALYPIRHLIPVTETNIPQDAARTAAGSMLWVLNSYRGFDQGQANRLVIADTSGANAIDDNTIQPVPDIVFRTPYVPNSLDYFANYGTYRNELEPEGFLHLTGASRELTMSPFMVNGTTRTSPKVPLGKLFGANQLTRFVQTSASGSWFVTGDFGLQLGE